MQSFCRSYLSCLSWLTMVAISLGQQPISNEIADLATVRIDASGSPFSTANSLNRSDESSTRTLNPPRIGNAAKLPESTIPTENTTKGSRGTDKVRLVSGSSDNNEGTKDRRSTDDGVTAASIEQKQQAVAAELRVAMMDEKREKATKPTEPTEPAADASRVDLLKQIDMVVAQQQSAASSAEDHAAQVTSLQQAFTRLSDGQFEEEPPFSILLLDGLKESVRNTSTKLASADSGVTSAREAAESAKLASEQAAKHWRQAKELDPNGETLPTIIAELEQKLAEERLVLKRQELTIAEANREIANLQLEIDQTKVRIIGDEIVFRDEDLQKKVGDIDRLELELQERGKRMQVELQFAERRWLAARQQADAMAGTDAEAVQRVESLKVSQMTIQHELSLINQRLQRLPSLRKSWQRRYLVATEKASRKERREWAEETQQRVEQLQQDRNARQLKIDELRTSQSTVDAKIDALAGETPTLKRWLVAKRDALDRQVNLFNNSLLTLDNSQRTLQRLSTQIEGEPGRSFGELTEDYWLHAKAVWNYELAAIDDTSLTVGKVCSSVIMLFVGFLLARWMSRLLGARLPSWGVDEAAAHAIESLSFYALLITLGLTALRYANVPLTVFTFLGGAIAIGIGFGSQNILNNFISGLILLAERPIKVGDLIMLDDTYGNVTKIGARSTQIRTGENQDIIVPNSKFLENNVTNLTRRDDRLRTSITIGVAYGSNLDNVVRLLGHAASDQSGVIDRPKPMVWFNDFGDNALVFQVHFWVHARNVAQMRMIETGVRLKIDQMFREAGIVIAFPQRDLHIQTTQPIDFRMVHSDPPKDAKIAEAA